jgi:hypothetical protein
MFLPRVSAGVACLGLWCAAAPAAAAVVHAGKHFLAPNMTGQQIAIMTTGGEAVAGVDLFVQVGDGGAAAGGDDLGPTITQLDLLTGALFAGNNTGVFLDSTPLLWGATTTTSAGHVAATGRLATLTINTTGFHSGRYDLILNPPATGATQLAGAATTVVNGWLNIGPPDAADFDVDGDVDRDDLLQWQDDFGPTGGSDADDDNDSDGADFLVWQRQIGSGNPTIAAQTAVPEPATWWLASTALQLTVVRSVRRYGTRARTGRTCGAGRAPCPGKRP